MTSTAIPIPQRRLSARRGSTSARDPFAIHADINQNPNRTSSSTLTIVRVLPQQNIAANPPITLNEPPSSFSSARRINRRLAQNPTSPPPTAQDAPQNTRLSFAFSSFGSADNIANASNKDRAPSPSSSPRLKPSSPRLSATGGSSYGISKPRLTPDQLVDLARQATNPRTLAQIANTAGPSSPAPISGSPVLRSQSPFGGNNHSSQSHLGTTSSVAPATFTPLPDDIYLPFLDRPSEVAQLISSPPDAKLFALLAQTFPKVNDETTPTTTPVTTSSAESPATSLIQLPADPTKWTYSHLQYHLIQIDRDVAPDPIWALAARKCILSHSELIWERVKGALGIPPELDVDHDFSVAGHKSRRQNRIRNLKQTVDSGSAFADDDEDDEDDNNSLDTDDISSDEGRAAHGHWSDWDATMDSPVFARNPKRLSAESPSVSIYFGRRKSASSNHGSPLLTREEQEGAFKNQMDDKLRDIVGGSGEGASRLHSSTLNVEDPTTGDTTISPTPVELDVDGMLPGSYSSSSLPRITTHAASPPTSLLGSLEGGQEYMSVSIEALIAPTAEPPPLSLGASLAGQVQGPDVLGDIAEGAEEEEEGAEPSASASGAGAEEINKVVDPDPDYISPSQIQGLRISTSPIPVSSSYGNTILPPSNTPPATVMSPVAISPAVGNMYSHFAAAATTTATAILGTEPYYETQTQTQKHTSHTHSRASSFGSVVGIGPFQRSESTGNLQSMLHASAAAVPHSGSEAGDSAGYLSDFSTTGIDAAGVGPRSIGDRASGHPLFVSNFARLNGGPTLGPTPSTRSPPPRFKMKRTESSSGIAGSVPGGSFGGHGLAGGKARSYSHGAGVSGGAIGLRKEGGLKG